MTREIPFRNTEAAEVKVKMKDGMESGVDKAKGHPIEKPLIREEIEEKFRTNIAFPKTVSKKNAHAALSMNKNLDEVGDIDEIVKLLVA